MMHRSGVRRLVAVVALAVLAGAAAPAPAQAPFASGPVMTVSGFVVDGQGMGLPGLTVRLVHPQLGPTPPTWTQPNGYYFIPNVPMDVASPYMVQVLWGSQLVATHLVRRPGGQPAITLR